MNHNEADRLGLGLRIGNEKDLEHLKKFPEKMIFEGKIIPRFRTAIIVSLTSQGDVPDNKLPFTRQDAAVLSTYLLTKLPEDNIDQEVLSLSKNKLSQIAEDAITYYLTPNKKDIRPIDHAVDEVVDNYRFQLRQLLPFPDYGGSNYANLHEILGSAASAIKKIPDNKELFSEVEKLKIVTEFNHPFLNEPTGLVFNPDVIGGLERLRFVAPNESHETLEKIEALKERTGLEVKRRLMIDALETKEWVAQYLADMNRKFIKQQEVKEKGKTNSVIVEAEKTALLAKRKKLACELGNKLYGNIFKIEN